MRRMLISASVCGALLSTGMLTAADPKGKQAASGKAAPAKGAGNCSIVVKGNDAMQFQDASNQKLDKITIPNGCSTFKVDFEHSGKLDMKVMGHNFIVSREADVDGVVKVAMSKFMANVADDKKYVTPVGKYDIDGKTVEVLVASDKLLGGGQKESIAFDVKKLKKGDKYKFFCSFPGHSGIMRGDLVLE